MIDGSGWNALEMGSGSALWQEIRGLLRFFLTTLRCLR